MPRDAEKTRKRIVDAAARLFYGEGIRSVSMDAVAARAGLTKKSLYYHFPSKDHLITAYLQSQDQPALPLYQHWYDETASNVNRRGLRRGLPCATV